MKKSIFFVFSLLFIATCNVYPINSDLKKLDLKYSMYYKQGDYLKAQEYLYLILSKKDSFSIESIGRYYNELGIIKKKVGRYDSAEYYFNKYLLIGHKNCDFKNIIYALNNLAILYKNQGNYSKAIEYYQKSLSILTIYEDNIIESYYCYYMLNYNLAIVYFYTKDYSKSLNNLEQSQLYNQSANLKKESKINYYKARCYHQMHDTLKAFKFYKECISQEIKLNGKNHIKVALKNVEFGKFLANYSFKEDAFEYFRSGLRIYLEKYPQKHPDLSNTFLLFSKYFLKQNQLDSTIYYNQKALISVVSDFDELNFYKNPNTIEALSKLEYLNALKAKTELLQLIANRATDAKEKQKNLDFGIETLNLALNVFNNIREGFLTEENKLFITENEKELFSLGIRICMQLHDLTGDNAYVHKALQYSSACKSSLLRTSMKLYDYLYSEQGTDSTRKKLLSTQREIAAYEKLIHDEKMKKGQNMQLLGQYQDNVFKLKRTEEDILIDLQGNLHKAADDSLNIGLLQKQLQDGRTIIEYHLAAQGGNKNRALYIFVIHQNGIFVSQHEIDTVFTNTISRVKHWMAPKQNGIAHAKDKQQFIADLQYLYQCLIEPAESFIAGNKLVVIPDGGLAGLSFDILLAGETAGKKAGFSALPYLIKQYSISYALSLPFIGAPGENMPERAFVSAFAPEYSKGPLASVRKDFGMLKNLEYELEGILEYFEGQRYTKTDASEQTFRHLAGRQHMFHFAMHADYDSTNHKFSYLAFQPGTANTNDDGYLYSYEIGPMHLNSPMVVLSACNTGVGKQVAGEGTLSLARSFFMAGAKSVVHTLWPVDDKASAGLMRNFYKYLAKGCDKARALQKAKLEYLSSSRFQSETDPVFWAGFVVSGDASVVTINKLPWVVIVAVLGVVLLIVLLIKQTRKNHS